MKRIILYILFIVLISVSLVNAQAYSVKTSGGDYTAWDTCMNAISPGNNCQVYDGVAGSGTISNSGSAGSGYITLEPGPGQTPTINSITLGSSGSDTLSYIIIQNLNISGSIHNNSVSSGSAVHSYIQILNNTMTGSGNGTNAISLKADNILISGNTFSGWGDDPVRQFGDSWVVRNNTATGLVACNPPTCDPGEHLDFWQSFCSGATVSRVGTDSLVENNSFINITGNGNEHFMLSNSTSSCGLPVHDILSRYNKSHYVGALAGEQFDNNSIAAGTTRNHQYNNTYSYSKLGSPTNDYVSNMNGSDYSSAINNIVTESTTTSGIRGFVGTATGWEKIYNLYFVNGQTITLSGTEIGSVLNLDPGLGDPINNDFSIGASSPAVDMGRGLTYTNGGKTSSSALDVDNASLFFEGNGIVDGDSIWIQSVLRLFSSNGDGWMDAEYGSNGATVTSAYLTQMTHGGDGSWGYRDGSDGSSKGTVDTSNYYQMPNALNLDGTWYNDTSSTRGIKYTNDGTAQQWRYTFAGSHNQAVLFAVIKAPSFSPSGEYHDLIAFGSSGGGDCVAQFVYADCSNNCSTHLYIQAHCAGTEFGNTTRSDQETPADTIPYSSYANTNMLVILVFDNIVASFTVYAYSLPSMTYIGMADITDAENGSTLSGKGIENFWFGNDPHGNSDNPHYFDDIVWRLDTTDIIPPTSDRQYAQISSISGNTLNLTSTLGSWLDYMEVGLWKISDGTVVIAGNAPDIGAFEYGVLTQSPVKWPGIKFNGLNLR